MLRLSKLIFGMENYVDIGKTLVQTVPISNITLMFPVAAIKRPLILEPLAAELRDAERRDSATDSIFKTEGENKRCGKTGIDL